MIEAISVRDYKITGNLIVYVGAATKATCTFSKSHARYVSQSSRAHYHQRAVPECRISGQGVYGRQWSGSQPSEPTTSKGKNYRELGRQLHTATDSLTNLLTNPLINLPTNPPTNPLTDSLIH